MEDFKSLNGSDQSDLKVDEKSRNSLDGSDENEVKMNSEVEDDKKSPIAGGGESADVIEVVDDDDDDENDDEEEEEEEVDAGNPDRPPGEDAVREIDADHLLPFFHGWKREVVVRKGNPKVRGSITLPFIGDFHSTMGLY